MRARPGDGAAPVAATTTADEANQAEPVAVDGAAPWPRRAGRRLAPWRWGTDARGRSAWRRGRVLAALAVLCAALTAFPSVVPNSPGGMGSLLETFRPWLPAAAVALLGVLGVLRRSRLALVALGLPAVVWLAVFGPLLLPASGGYDLTVVQHNVSDENADPAGTARALAAAGPDLIALEELTPAELPAYRAALASAYPHHATAGTVGLWSTYPLSDDRAVDIRPSGIAPGWLRGLRATAHTPEGEVAVHVAHLPSVRIGARGLGSGLRDESARMLGRELAAERQDRVILLGDLNSTLDDRGLAPVAEHATGAERGLAPSWPAALPLARIDQVMARSATVTDLWTLPRTDSDHLPVAARIRFGDSP